MAFLVVAFVAEVVVVQYGRAAVHRAVDEGARAGSALGAGVAECQERAEEVLRGWGGLLRGALGNTLSIECEIDRTADPPHIVVEARGQLGLGLPLLRRASVDASGVSVVEQAP